MSDGGMIMKQDMQKLGEKGRRQFMNSKSFDDHSNVLFDG